MDEKERKELIDKILAVDGDAKSARVAATVFVNKASDEEAEYFLNYLDHNSASVKKMARHILGQKGIKAAVDKLIAEFHTVVKELTFMPDAEYTEAHYYSNLIEILETIFTIVKSTGYQNTPFYTRIEEIFKRTKNEDLRFTLIKILGIMGDCFDYFMKYFDDFTEKERRALYYVYSMVEDPRRIALFKKGLLDDKNLEYVITSMLNFKEGKEALCNELLGMSNYTKQAVLKKLQDGKYPEFNDTLIKLMTDKNKFLVEMSIEILKKNLSANQPMDPFINMIETGFSPEGIQGALEIISHFLKKKAEDIYLNGLDKQPAIKNKQIILDFLISKLKVEIKVTEELTDKLVPKLLSFFDIYTKEKEDLFLSIFKIIANLSYSNSGKIKAIKKKVLGFGKEFEKRIPNQFKNNMNEFLVKCNQMVARFDEVEAKLKHVVLLFEIDHTKVEHERMLKLKSQLQELDPLDEDTTVKLVQFLSKLLTTPKIDWKVRTVALDLMGIYGGINEIPILANVIETESSLAVKTNAQKALKKIEENNADNIQSVLIMEPLFYLQKMLSEFFKARSFRVFELKEFSKFEEISDKAFRYIAVSENILTPEFTQQLFDYADNNCDTTLIILTAKPETMESYRELPNVKILKKPFNNESLNEVLT